MRAIFIAFEIARVYDCLDLLVQLVAWRRVLHRIDVFLCERKHKNLIFDVTNLLIFDINLHLAHL